MVDAEGKNKRTARDPFERDSVSPPVAWGKVDRKNAIHTVDSRSNMFLDASSHLINRVCWLVGQSVGHGFLKKNPKNLYLYKSVGPSICSLTLL